MKVQKWFQNGSNSIIQGVMINFWFFEIQKSDLLVGIWWIHQNIFENFGYIVFFKRQQSTIHCFSGRRSPRKNQNNLFIL